MMKLVTKPKLLTRICMIGPAIKLAKPNPMIARPVANPRLFREIFYKSGNRSDISNTKTNTTDYTIADVK